MPDRVDSDRFPGEVAADHAKVGRVMIVDDEPAILRLAVATLELSDIEVATATDGSEAVRLLEQARDAKQPFEIVILDLNLEGGIDGIATLAEMRALEPTVCAIATSGDVGADALIDPEAFGFQASIAKPYAPADLIAAISEVLRGGCEPAPGPEASAGAESG